MKSKWIQRGFLATISLSFLGLGISTAGVLNSVYEWGIEPMLVKILPFVLVPLITVTLLTVSAEFWEEFSQD